MLEYEAKSLKIHVLFFGDYQKSIISQFFKLFQAFFQRFICKNFIYIMTILSNYQKMLRHLIYNSLHCQADSEKKSKIQ